MPDSPPLPLYAQINSPPHAVQSKKKKSSQSKPQVHVPLMYSNGSFRNILFTKTGESRKTFPENQLPRGHFSNRFFMIFFSFSYNFFPLLQFFFVFHVFKSFFMFFFCFWWFFFGFYDFFHRLDFFPRDFGKMYFGKCLFSHMHSLCCSEIKENIYKQRLDQNYCELSLYRCAA